MAFSKVYDTCRYTFSRHPDRFIMIVLFLLSLIGYLFFLPSLPITDPVESNYALTAKAMISDNSWLSPVIYDRFWYDKPIFTYWAIIMSFKVFGISTFAARLPSALFASLTVPFFYYMVHKMTSARMTSVMSAAFLGTSFMFWYLAHGVITDMYLMTFTVGIFGSAYLGLTQGRPAYMVLAYVMSALAVLVKGPVGIVLPGMCLLLFVMLTTLKKRRPADGSQPMNHWKLLFYPPAILAFLVVALPWYLFMIGAHGQAFIDGFFLLHNGARATVSEHPRFNVWYYYLLVIPITLLPWSFVALYGMKSALAGLWRRRAHQAWRHTELSLYLLIWAVLPTVFFSLVATKYPTYCFTVLIPLTIFAALGWQRLRLNKGIPHRVTKLFFLVAFVPIVLYFGLMAGAIQFHLSLLPLLVLLPLAIILWAYAAVTKRDKALPYVASGVLTTMLFFGATAMSIAPVMVPQSGEQWGDAVQSLPVKTIYIYDDYSTSLVFYSNRRIVRIMPKMPSDLWEKGKDVMPLSTVPEAVSQVKDNSSAAILVSDRNLKDFKKSPLYAETEESATSPAGLHIFLARK